jgi:hypothetical protein
MGGVGVGGVVAPEFAGPVLGFDGAPSPLTMFDSMANGNMDFSSNFDWVSVFLERFTRYSASHGPY